MRPAAVGSAIALVLAGGACSTGSQEPARARVTARLVGLRELDAAVRQNLRRGGLVNLWATW